MLREVSQFAVCLGFSLRVLSCASYRGYFVFSAILRGTESGLLLLFRTTSQVRTCICDTFLEWFPFLG